MSAVLDRDAAREVLHQMWSDAAPARTMEAWLDALEACVRPAPPQGIDRNALSEEVWLLVNIIRDGMWTNQRVEEAIDRIFALLRPVEGVVLTPEEARRAAGALRWIDEFAPANVRFNANAGTLAARLQAAS